VVVFDYSANHSCAPFFADVPRPWLQLLHRPRTFKWPAVHAFFTEGAAGIASLARYEYIMAADDDVDFHHAHAAAGGSQPQSVASLFEICAAAGAYLCQPSLSAQSSGLFATTFSVHHAAPTGSGGGVAFLRASGFVEQMLPVFSRTALAASLPYMAGLTHAWGIDALWSDAAAREDGGSGEQGRRLVAVVDSVQVDHLRPSGVSGLYRRVGGLEAARRDQDAFKARHGIRETVFAAAAAAGGGAVLTVPVPAAVVARAQRPGQTHGAAVQGGA